MAKSKAERKNPTVSKAREKAQEMFLSLLDKMIEKKKKGEEVKWEFPWNKEKVTLSDMMAFMPRNPTRGDAEQRRRGGVPYKGVNNMLLTSIGFVKGYTDSRWMTPKQANALAAQWMRANGEEVEWVDTSGKTRSGKSYSNGYWGDPNKPFEVKDKEGNVIKEIPSKIGMPIKGETSSPVEFWIFTQKKKVYDDDGAPLLDEEGNPIKKEVRLERPKCVSYAVFNVEQFDMPPEPTVDKTDREEAFEEDLKKADLKTEQALLGIKEKTDLTLQEGHTQAFYAPDADLVGLPPRHAFVGETDQEQMEKRNATALHELSHAVDLSPKRLGNIKLKDEPDEDGNIKPRRQHYAECEVVAEFSTLILAGLGYQVEKDTQTGVYLAGWGRDAIEVNGERGRDQVSLEAFRDEVAKNPHAFAKLATRAQQTVQFIKDYEATPEEVLESQKNVNFSLFDTLSEEESETLSESQADGFEGLPEDKEEDQSIKDIDPFASITDVEPDQKDEEEDEGLDSLFRP